MSFTLSFGELFHIFSSPEGGGGGGCTVNFKPLVVSGEILFHKTVYFAKFRLQNCETVLLLTP